MNRILNPIPTFGLADVDYLNLHLYFQDPRWFREGLDLYDWLQRYLPPKPAILGLWNTPEPSAPHPVSVFPFDDRYLRALYHQALRGFQQRRILRHYPWIEKYWHWNAYDYFECPHYSLLFWDKTPKPIYNVVAAQTWKLAGSDYVGPLELLEGSVQGEVFDRRGQAVVTLWAEEPTQITLEDVAGPVTLTDLMGRTRTTRADGQLPLEVGPAAIYVEPPGSAWIERAAEGAQRLQEAEQYWRQHAVLIVEGPGRSGPGERILPAGQSKGSP